MVINKLDIVLVDDAQIEYSICRLTLAKNSKDIFFIDKSFDNFHISIHKSGNVSMTFQKDWKERKNIRIFKFDWKLIDEEVDKEKPLLLYIPVSKQIYPKSKKNKRGSATFLIDNIDNIDKLSFKFFVINQDISKPKIRTTDIGVTVTRTQLEKRNGEVVNENIEKSNPTIRFNNNLIRFSVGTINDLRDFSNYRFLFLFQPTTEIDMTYFLNNNIFKIDFNQIAEKGYYLRKYKIKSGHEISMLVY